MIRLTSVMAVAAACFMPFTAAQAQQLTVYTALESDLLPIYKASFEAANPGITIQWVRDSTGVITAKLLAERDNPRADVVLGTAATSLLMLKSEGMLEPFAPVGVENLDPRFVDQDEPPYWVGTNAWAAALCVNTVEMEKAGVAIPTSWADLIKPEYTGMIVMPNPASSGTGFLDVSSWLQMMGEEEGWAFMDALHKNIATYTHSGSKPCTMAASGEHPIGVSFEFRAVRLLNEGAPLAIVIPSEGIGWDMEASAIIAGTPNLEAAEALLNWSVSDEAMAIYAQNYAILANEALEVQIPDLPADLRSRLIENDFEWAANNRTAILEEWQSRFDGKSEPKN
ncbi:MAG: putative 2-aminoethylphosphonate ABC transporter substrate-binding protein [Rhodobacterales bacterium]|nr:putative 2-aminoethylphosphonate ABC transporter substrate-binding protein [Rhodobacterales bacterium]